MDPDRWRRQSIVRGGLGRVQVVPSEVLSGRVTERSFRRLRLGLIRPEPTAEWIATRLIEDIGLDRHDSRMIVKMGYLAQYVLDKRLPLEICLTSNVDTGAVPSLEEHPFGLLYAYRFRVTLNTDDRLMSDTTMTRELLTAHRVFGLGIDDFEKLTINAMKSAFLPYNRRLEFIYDVIKPGYTKARRKRTKPRT